MRARIVITALVTALLPIAGPATVRASDATPRPSAPPAKKTPAPGRWKITDPGQGPVTLPKGDTGARQTSGITWVEGSRYYIVSDKLGTAFPVAIELDPHNGTITRASVEQGLPLIGSTDLEGVAYDRDRKTLLVSDEVGPAIREYDARDGRLVRSLNLPPIYRSARKNLSLESLAYNPDDQTLWTANEETLAEDGATSNFAAGSVVRVQRFDSERQPNGQWAYVTDALAGDMLKPGRDIESNGVSDLVALPGGGLVALERGFGSGGLRIRLYEIDFVGATDITSLPSLVGASYSPLRKRLLWQQSFPNINYEGAALGPSLADGARSLILISDDGYQQRQALYALTLQRAP